MAGTVFVVVVVVGARWFSSVKQAHVLGGFVCVKGNMLVGDFYQQNWSTHLAEFAH